MQRVSNDERIRPPPSSYPNYETESKNRFEKLNQIEKIKNLLFNLS